MVVEQRAGEEESGHLGLTPDSINHFGSETIEVRFLEESVISFSNDVGVSYLEK